MSCFSGSRRKNQWKGEARDKFKSCPQFMEKVGGLMWAEIFANDQLEIL